jgi:hypothetical protein
MALYTEPLMEGVLCWKALYFNSSKKRWVAPGMRVFFTVFREVEMAVTP